MRRPLMLAFTVLALNVLTFVFVLIADAVIWDAALRPLIALCVVSLVASMVIGLTRLRLLGPSLVKQMTGALIVVGVASAEVFSLVGVGAGHRRHPPPPDGDVPQIEIDDAGNPIVIVDLEELSQTARLVKRGGIWGQMTLIYFGDGDAAGHHDDWKYIGRQTVEIEEILDDMKKKIAAVVTKPGHYVFGGPGGSNALKFPSECEWVRIHMRLWTEERIGLSGYRQRTLALKKDLRRPRFQVRLLDDPVTSWPENGPITLNIAATGMTGWSVDAASRVRITAINKAGAMVLNPQVLPLEYNAGTWQAQIARSRSVDRVSLTIMVGIKHLTSAGDEDGYRYSHDSDDSVQLPQP